MLSSAADAALKMPRLRKMEIWNGTARDVNACVFRYRAMDQATTIQLIGSFAFDLDAELVSRWRMVARANSRNELSVLATEAIQMGRIKSHADAIRELMLDEGVAHRVSLLQIQRESNAFHIPGEAAMTR
jgi:hypothetical protein